MKGRAALADSEWILMQIIWESAPCTYRQICDAACEANGWTRYVVSSYLKRMEAKGAIRTEAAMPVKLYYPVLDKNETIRAETAGILNRVYNGDLLLMLETAVSAQPLSDEEYEELEGLLKAGRHDHA